MRHGMQLDTLDTRAQQRLQRALVRFETECTNPLVGLQNMHLFNGVVMSLPMCTDAVILAARSAEPGAYALVFEYAERAAQVFTNALKRIEI